MSTTELRRKLKKDLDALPTDRLRSAADFIAFLSREDSQSDAPAEAKRLRLRQKIRETNAAEVSKRLIPLEKLPAGDECSNSLEFGVVFTGVR